MNDSRQSNLTLTKFLVVDKIADIKYPLERSLVAVLSDDGDLTKTTVYVALNAQNQGQLVALAGGDTPSEDTVEMGVHSDEGDGTASQVISIPFEKEGVESFFVQPINEGAINAGIQKVEINGQNLEVTVVTAGNGEALTYNYLVK